MIGDTTDLMNAFGNTAAASRVNPLSDLAANPSGFATLQSGFGEGKSVTNTAPTTVAKPPTAITRKPVTLPGTTSTTPTPTPSAEPGGDIWGELQTQLSGVDAAFDTSKYDAASEKAMGNIISASEESANTAATQYANRARQAGGSAEGAGLVKAEALVSGRRTAEDVGLQKEQYDIAQKEAAKQLAAEISAHIDSLRMDYLKNLTQKQIAELQSKTQEDIANTEAKWRQSIASGQLGLGYAQLGQQSYEWNYLHPPRSNNSTLGYTASGQPLTSVGTYDAYINSFG